MICPIRFIRKPEESECIREKCAFWLEEEDLGPEEKETDRFYAVIGGPTKDIKDQKEHKSIGHCAVLSIAQSLTKSKL